MSGPRSEEREPYRERVVPFEAGDGLECNLINVRGLNEPTKGPIVLVHGAGVRANIFRAPVRRTIVDALVEDGYDVWLENWRASIDLAPNLWTLDQAALYDHPAAVKTILRETRRSELKAIIHCQGSTSFAMSAVAGLVPEVTTIVSNAVSLHPVVARWARVKLTAAVPFVHAFTPYLNPGWGLSAPTLVAKTLTTAVRITHRECDNTVCRLVSFTYGSGCPALWSHENLNDETHDWLEHEFAEVPLRFFRQMARCVKRGHLVAYEDLPGLPRDFAEAPPKTDARWVFLAGEDNRCFLPASQERSFDYFNGIRKDHHSLHVLAGYGHLDVFMGVRASEDVFPIILEELDG